MSALEELHYHCLHPMMNNKEMELARPSMPPRGKKTMFVERLGWLMLSVFHESGWSDHAQHIGLIFTLHIMLTQQIP